MTRSAYILHKYTQTYTEETTVFTSIDSNNYLISLLALSIQTIALVELYCSLEPNSLCDLCFKGTY